MAGLPIAKMAAKMAAVPMMEMRRPVIPVMAVMSRVAEVVSAKVMIVVEVVKVAGGKSMTEAAKAAGMTAEPSMRHGARCRERNSKQTNSGDDW